MKIGLLDIDGQAKVKKYGATIYPNLALCKIASYHKQRGDSVEWASQLEHYDIIYRSKVFTFSQDDNNLYSADKVVRGGTGYDIRSQLPQEIDDCQPDLSIYPTIPKGISYGFLSRGCPNKCGWCVVPEKEGGGKTILGYRPSCKWQQEYRANGQQYLGIARLLCRASTQNHRARLSYRFQPST